MEVRNKQESNYYINKLNLNHMLTGNFNNTQYKEVKQFLNDYQYAYYNIRDTSQSMGNFLYKLTKEDILNQIHNYNNFCIYESLYDADNEHLILQGEIQIKNDFTILASMDNQKGISNREAMKSPKYKINIDLKEFSEPNIKGLKQVIDYIINHELFDLIVEFTLYDIQVGINKENIIIWELRNY